MNIQTVWETHLEQPIGKLRAVPVNLGGENGILLVYSASAEVDPYVEMFFFPPDTLKLALLDSRGKLVWRRDLERGVIPGIWFCPVFPFDLEGKGQDDIWFVNNSDEQHPLGIRNYVLECADAASGDKIGQWPWSQPDYNQSLSHTFRNFIFGGHARGEPVLVTAQGTYGPMQLQGWHPGVEMRWKHTISRETPGARGSHMCAVVDLNRDNVDEVLWGERCIELDHGRQLFCADASSYHGHSDIAQPIFNRKTNSWSFFTCREKHLESAPRIALYNSEGERVWGAIDEGHIDMGWAARLGNKGEHRVMGIRIGNKVAGPDGFLRGGIDELVYDAESGEPVNPPVSVFETIPVDLNGDGCHMLVKGMGEQSEAAVLDNQGNVAAELGGTVAMASKFLNLPGEQILIYHEDGTVRVWHDADAEDSADALARYTHPFYRTNQKLTATGYNLVNLGGI